MFQQANGLGLIVAADVGVGYDYGCDYDCDYDFHYYGPDVGCLVSMHNSNYCDVGSYYIDYLMIYVIGNYYYDNGVVVVAAAGYYSSYLSGWSWLLRLELE